MKLSLKLRRSNCYRLSLLSALLVATIGLYVHEYAVRQESSGDQPYMMEGYHQSVYYLKNRSGSGIEAKIFVIHSGNAAWVDRSTSAGKQTGFVDVNAWSNFWAQLEIVGAFSLPEGGSVAEGTNAYHSISISDSRTVRYRTLLFNDKTLTSNSTYRFICDAIDMVMKEAKWTPLTFSNKMDRFLVPIGQPQ